MNPYRYSNTKAVLVFIFNQCLITPKRASHYWRRMHSVLINNLSAVLGDAQWLPVLVPGEKKPGLQMVCCCHSPVCACDVKLVPDRLHLRLSNFFILMPPASVQTAVIPQRLSLLLIHVRPLIIVVLHDLHQDREMSVKIKYS